MPHAETELGEVAHRAVIAFIRGELRTLGLTQPQYWVLRHLCPDDPAPDGQGLTTAELTAVMRPYLGDHDLEPEVAGLARDGLVAQDDGGRLWVTEPGRRAHARVKEHAPVIRARLREGIDDAEYATMLSVLRRIIRNAGGEPDSDA
ncbi:MarR family winged helix-turn-helix transcriptional regulator [Streptomyces sp. NPDC050856]|uniref:MarR family winged helix-turn-helix transcriptional regulator n=1 Tax=Streptomyces sp. NPDC050856 TaxID=3154939 RepID=UPI0033EE5FE9